MDELLEGKEAMEIEGKMSEGQCGRDNGGRQ